jgi:hypothetical protein
VPEQCGDELARAAAFDESACCGLQECRVRIVGVGSWGACARFCDCLAGIAPGPHVRFFDPRANHVEGLLSCIGAKLLA